MKQVDSLPDSTPPSTQSAPGCNQSYVAFDWQEWLSFVNDMEGSEDEKRVLIEALWAIVLGFVDLGWEVSTNVPESCGQTLDLSALITSDVINLNQDQT